ncbi:MAG: carboxy terminal-processing peptidase [Fibrobacteres bacterium]|nr:carboxy terminal-processing peptidase [Fibrobacterota bacterium]
MKKYFSLLLIIAAAAIFLFYSPGVTSATEPLKYRPILLNVGYLLSSAHFNPKLIDDDFSEKVFRKYLESLDPERSYFFSRDIDSLKRFSKKIDNEINGDSPIAFFTAAGNIFSTRVNEASEICSKILSKPFDYSVDEIYDGARDKAEFPKSEKEREELLRKKMKFMALERYEDLLSQREKSKPEDSISKKTDAVLEAEARDKVQKIMNRTFDRYKLKLNNNDKFSIFVNTISTSMDAHTSYFPPIDKRAFDEQMSGTFFGIGAQLKEDDGRISIVSLVPGSPAWKSGQINKGDIITKVAQGAEAPVDMAGYTVDDAVKLIRGIKDTEVRLTLKKQDGSTKVVALIRAKIIQDEVYARSAVIKTSNGKYGLIYLPEFYAPFNSSNDRRASKDVANEIVKLKNENVNGIIVDLRYNGGGSLDEVVKMAGLFINEGAIVQVKDNNRKPNILYDKDPSILYDGPLVVMVNEYSASASEIFAAAIQDYNRGIIFGSSATYGKGTVQHQIDVDFNSFPQNNGSELGSLKLTRQKFYRITGASTQQKGVTPDIIVPSMHENEKFREKDSPDALAWDEIAPTPFTSFDFNFDKELFVKKQQARVSENRLLGKISSYTNWLSGRMDKSEPLQLAKYRTERKEVVARSSEIDTLLKSYDSLSVSFIKGEENLFADDSAKRERFDTWIKTLSRDVYINETVKIISGMAK